MSIESVLAKELERERERSSNLEFEIISLKAQLLAFEPHHYYPPNQNAQIADFRRFLKNFNEKSGGKKS
jgi:hypothetical protein